MGATNVSTKVFDERVQMGQEDTSSPGFQRTQTPPIAFCSRTFNPASVAGKISFSMSFDETGYSLAQFPWQRSHQFGSGSFTTKNDRPGRRFQRFPPQPCLLESLDQDRRHWSDPRQKIAQSECLNVISELERERICKTTLLLWFISSVSCWIPK